MTVVPEPAPEPMEPTIIPRPDPLVPDPEPHPAEPGPDGPPVLPDPQAVTAAVRPAVPDEGVDRPDPDALGAHIDDDGPVPEPNEPA